MSAAQPKDAANKIANTPEQQITDPAGNLTGPPKKANEPNDHDKPCEAGQNDRSSDLCAQWKAADAAKISAQAAWWIGSVGTLVGFATLAAAIAAAYFAAGANEAAKESLTHEKQVARAQLRPWICYRRYETGVFTDGVKANGERLSRGLHVRIHVFNAGVSPALNVQIQSGFAVTDMDVREPPHFPQAPRADGIADNSLGPQSENSTPILVIGPNDYDGLIARRKCLWLHSRTEYQEPGHTGEPYITEVTYRVMLEGEQVDENGNVTMIWGGPVAGPQNRMT